MFFQNIFEHLTLAIRSDQYSYKTEQDQKLKINVTIINVWDHLKIL